MLGTHVLRRHGAERRNDVFVDGGLGCGGRGCRLSLPNRRSSALVAKGVVTGGRDLSRKDYQALGGSYRVDRSMV